MPFTAQELANIANSALDFYMDKGKLHTNNVQNKPLLRALDSSARTFPGGKEFISIGVKSGQGGPALAGYTHDDQVSYSNPTPAKRLNFPWKEMHQGMGLTWTELKKDGITVTESDGSQNTSSKDGREDQALANMLEEKLDDMAEAYNSGMNLFLHGDGSGDAKAIAGIRAFILDDPSAGSTGGLSRATNTWWRNRAATSAADSAGSGADEITSSPTNGGALLQFLQKEKRQLMRYAKNGVSHYCIAGSDFIDAMETELRANGMYTQRGFGGAESVDGAMATDEYVPFGKWKIYYDPTLDDLGDSKRLYVIDRKNILLFYMQGEKAKKSNPTRPHDRYVLYRGVTTTGVLVARQLNTSGVYDIA